MTPTLSISTVHRVAVLLAAVVGFALFATTPAVSSATPALRSATPAQHPVTSASAAWPTEGTRQADDPYFPHSGNSGYQVVHYDLDLTYRPPAGPPGSRPTPTGPPGTEAPPTAAPPGKTLHPHPSSGRIRSRTTSPAIASSSGRLQGVAIITAQVTSPLHILSLDLNAALRATSVLVNGMASEFAQGARKLMIRPVTPLAAGMTATIEVRYGGATGVPRDGTGVPYGWVTLPGGAVAANAPDGAATWFPVNDSPGDPATFHLRIAVPEGLAAVASGQPSEIAPRARAGMTTWEWTVSDSTAPHLLGLAVGSYSLTEDRLPNGTVLINAYDTMLRPAEITRVHTVLARLPALMGVYERNFGPYPHRSFGVIIDRRWDPYVVDSHTRPILPENLTEHDLAYSLAHQWFGDAVRHRTWKDVWLTEAMSTYGVWLWLAAPESGARVPVQTSFESVMAIDPHAPFWDVVVADPGPTRLFDSALHLRGAAALHAVARHGGRPDASSLLRQYFSAYRTNSARTEDFETWVSSVVDRNVTPVLDEWIRSDVRPGTFPQATPAP